MDLCTLWCCSYVWDVWARCSTIPWLISALHSQVVQTLVRGRQKAFVFKHRQASVCAVQVRSHTYCSPRIVWGNDKKGQKLANIGVRIISFVVICF